MEKPPELFSLVPPDAEPVPIILNLPHSGTYIPDGIDDALNDEHRKALDETDWFLDTLYDFAPSLGITTLKANYHRWVVDLNRDKEGKSLYTDGRVITEVVPTKDFNGSSLYKSTPPNKREVNRRIKDYYLPYYSQLQRLIDDTRKTYGRVLLWDGHSIRRVVPGIQSTPFPDFVVGSAAGKSAPHVLINSITASLRASGMDVQLNDPFQGGNITRSFHDLGKRQYCVQLEMSKDLYMDDTEVNYDLERSSSIAKLLKTTFNNLIKLL